MSKKTNEALRFILDAPEGTYQADALTAARQEWDQRQVAIPTEIPPVTATAIKDMEEPPVKAALKPDVELETAHQSTPCAPVVEQQRPVERYPALKLIAGFYNVLAWLVLVAVVLGLAGMAAMEILTGWRVAGLMLGGGLLFVSLMALSEVIKLFIDMEKNTRHGVKQP